MTRRLLNLIESLGTPRAFVVGDLLLDRYVWGRVNRVSPEAPIQILNVDREELRPGGAGNVARNLAALGARVRCAGVVGRDKEGDALVRLLKSCRVDPSAVLRTSEKPTAVKTRMIAHAQQMLRVDNENIEPLNGALQRRLAKSVAAAAGRADVAVVSDYNKGTLPPAVCAALIRAFRRRGKPVIVGLKSSDTAKYVGATGAMLNRGELESLTGLRDVAAAARKLIARMKLDFVVATLGEKGLQVVDKAGRSVTLPTAARAVYDVTGAGDTCLAAFAIAHASGLSLQDCAAVANAAAGVVVGKVGTEQVDRDELARYVMQDELHPQRKIVTTRELPEVVRVERARDRSIVFTNGCFDVLHAGHVSLLQFSKARGDVLIVGINSDRSIRRLKGPGRPVLNERDRARILAAMEAVDYVVVFDEPTPAKLARLIRPDTLVKGEDWKGKTVVGRPHAGRVEFAPIVKGLSTTALVKKIRGGK